MIDMHYSTFAFSFALHACGPSLADAFVRAEKRREKTVCIRGRCWWGAPTTRRKRREGEEREKGE